MYVTKHAVLSLVYLVALVSAFPLHNSHHIHRRHAKSVIDSSPVDAPRRRSKCNPRNTTVPGTTGGVAQVIPSYVSGKPTQVASQTAAGTPTESKPTATSKPAKPSQSDKPSQPNKPSAIGGLLGMLFPVEQSSGSWTTSPSSGSLPLADSTFRPEKEIKNLAHTYTKAPDGKAAMKAHYPKGSYNFGHQPQGGFSFYAPGPSQVDLTTAKEATFGYSVFFEKGFNFVKGGKLPGLYGGNSDEVAASCSGGRRDDACFSARLMWRANGAGEFYTYLPPSEKANQAVCNVKPESDCNPTYGASVGRGAFEFATGQWTTVSERVRLNDVGKANGELELFVNGNSVINVGGLVLRTSSAGKIRGLQMQTFFGGSSTDFATPKDQDVYFSDFSVAITEKL